MPRGRILIVEDEYLVAADLEAALEERGYETVGIAPDLLAAMALAPERPDLAIVDVHLRDGPTGPEIAERLSREHGVPVVFVTANPNLVMEQPAPGALGVLGKPCGEDVIGQTLDYFLAGDDRAVSPPEGLRLFQADA